VSPQGARVDRVYALRASRERGSLGPCGPPFTCPCPCPSSYGGARRGDRPHPPPPFFFFFLEFGFIVISRATRHVHYRTLWVPNIGFQNDRTGSCLSCGAFCIPHLHPSVVSRVRRLSRAMGGYQMHAPCEGLITIHGCALAHGEGSECMGRSGWQGGKMPWLLIGEVRLMGWLQGEVWERTGGEAEINPV